MEKNKKIPVRIKSGFVLLCLIAPLVLVSCATKLSTRASRVYLLSAVQVHEVEAQCEFLGNVTGTSFFSSGGCLSWCVGGLLSWNILGRTGYNNSLNELLDNAAEIGATHVFVNLGSGPDMRGAAYCCAYCLGPDGNPDRGYCLGPDNNPDIAYCEDIDGNLVGAAHCEGAEGENQAECEANCGKWIPAIDQIECEKQENTWVPEAENQDACEAKGGIWLPRATDQITCEETKGGTWVLDEDVIRLLLLEPAEGDQVQ